MSLYFWIVLFSFWQIDGDAYYFVERLRIKMPFLLIPLAYLGLPKLTGLSFNRILYFFILLMSISVVGVLLLYAYNYEEVNELLKQGQHLAAPCNHIRFSVSVALSVIAVWYLVKKKFGSNTIHEKIIKALGVFLFVAIHILSVKTGIVCLYAAMIVLAFREIYTSRKYKLGVSIIAILIFLPVLAYKTVPSFNRKVHYTIYDLQMYGEGQGSNYGDSGRITSIAVAYKLFKKSPFIGTGAGNLNNEVAELFAKDYPEYEKPLMPHNQFMFVIAGSGIMGFILFLIALFLPLLYRRAYRNDFYLGFYILFLTSFMIEHTIENALGVGMFSSFILLCLLFVHNGEHTKKTINFEESNT